MAIAVRVKEETTRPSSADVDALHREYASELLYEVGRALELLRLDPRRDAWLDRIHTLSQEIGQ